MTFLHYFRNIYIPEKKKKLRLFCRMNTAKLRSYFRKPKLERPLGIFLISAVLFICCLNSSNPDAKFFLFIASMTLMYISGLFLTYELVHLITAPFHKSVREWMAYEVNNFVLKHSLKVTGISEKDLVEKSQIVRSPVQWIDCGFEPHDILWKVCYPERFICVTVNHVFVVHFLKNRLVVFNGQLNFFEKLIIKDGYTEAYYEDISAVEKGGGPVPFKFLSEKGDDEMDLGGVMKFSIHLRSGSPIEVSAAPPKPFFEFTKTGRKLFDNNFEGALKAVRTSVEKRKITKVSSVDEPGEPVKVESVG